MADVAPWMLDIFPERYFAHPERLKKQPEQDVPGTAEIKDKVTSTLSGPDQDSKVEKEKVNE